MNQISPAQSRPVGPDARSREWLQSRGQRRVQSANQGSRCALVSRGTQLGFAFLSGVARRWFQRTFPSSVVVVTAGVVLVGSSQAGASTTLHYWTGGSATSGNWSVGANWQSGSAPSGGDQRLIFRENAARKINTNNLPAGTTFESIWVVDDGYNIYGNAVRINYIRGRCPMGTSTTFRPDIIAAQDLQIINETNNSTFNVLGDVLLGANDLVFPSFANPGDIVMGGVISGSGRVFKQNTGDVRFSGLGANTYTGSTYVSGGILRLNRYIPGSGLQLLGTTAIPGDLFIGDSGGTLIGDVVVLDRENQIANTSAVSVYPTGSLELSDENETVGGLTLSGGTVTTGTGVLGVNGDILAVVSSGVSKDSTIAGRLTLGARGSGAQIIEVTQGAQLNISAQISGVTSATLIKTNRGELFLTVSNSFSGDVEIHGGTLVTTHPNALGNTTGVTKVMLGTLAISGTMGIAEILEVSGPSGTLQLLGGSASWLGPVQLDDHLAIVAATNSTLSIVGRISGPDGWTKLGDGTLQFKTPYTNDYAGTSWVRDGQFIMDGVMNQPVVPGPLIIGNATGPAQGTRAWPIKQNQIADLASVVIEQSGILEMGSLEDTVGSLSGSGVISIGSGGSLAVGRNGASTSFSGVLSGPGDFQKVGGGVLTLTGTNSHTGPVHLAEGTLQVDGSIASSLEVRLNFPFSPTNAYPAVLAGNGSVPAIVPQAGGTVAAGAGTGGAGRLTVGGPCNLSHTAVRIEINGPTAGIGHDQIRALAGVTLDDTPLIITAGFVPSTNDLLTILEKVGAGSISGTFKDAPEGAVLNVGALQFRISYQGGDGNDVVLRRINSGLPILSGIMASSPEEVTLNGQGEPFATYILEAKSSLGLPIPWVPIATNQADASGFYVFTDLVSENGVKLHAARFYRLRRD